uniref:Uncharacterized protein n=1 Tax=Timema poppense TaxID=170557 RepID=A0A7R9H3T2_TIMPO|nr:unnamed protein product [Timema poppensis]
MSIEANYALERIYNWSDLDLKKPKQQQQRTVQLLQHALELCSNFYKSEQNKRQTNTEKTGKIKDHVTNKIKVPIMKTDKMIIKPDHRYSLERGQETIYGDTIPSASGRIESRPPDSLSVFFEYCNTLLYFSDPDKLGSSSEASREENSGMRIEYSGRLGTTEFFPEARLQG